ncbi:uncharacterized protein STEHIDRAFT_48148 [Stereum hirsutum FP-91666 SS1]|uniref:uncharacterized protein n=1 Tax=Stereum hirsutum (strain FP-91666) TaxID=721885 RepID=UPI000440DAB2|nr:uncharacterized protein STEHIDRAFT_48148 [Stereum hirsutum FP-91666 SS1]EIM92277.1 hypothetical protein STEHIDRAFT_48148 [Stereum hirsutum FP-91666 SS1]
MSTITVPQGFGYVPPAALFLLGVLVWQTSRVGRSRGKAGIKYPQVYADAAQQAASKEAMVFNCAQRAHQNTLEALPIVLTTTAITALQYPIVAAGGLGVWAFSRIFYTLGYMTGQPEKVCRYRVFIDELCR